MKMPNRFDIIYATDVDSYIKPHKKGIQPKKCEEKFIGYISDVKDDGRKGKLMSNSSLPTSSPKTYYIKFLNLPMKTMADLTVQEFITAGAWRVVSPSFLPLQGKSKYNVGDLIMNKMDKKINLIVEVVNLKKEECDIETFSHSQRWYKVQSPGQQWEPLSETFINHGEEHGNFIVKKRKLNT